MPTPERCTATSRRTGERCGNWPARGATVCRFHGAATPQVKRKAAERLEAKKAEKVLTKLWNQDAAPVLDARAELANHAGRQRDLVEATAETMAVVNEIDCPCCGRGPDTDQINVAAHQRIAKEYRETLVAASKIDLGDRVVSVEEQKVGVMIVAMLAAIDKALPHLNQREKHVFRDAFFESIKEFEKKAPAIVEAKEIPWL